MSRSSTAILAGSPFARMRSMTSSRRPLRRAAATWAAHTYAASRSRTAVRMATERSFASTTLSSRKKVTRGSTRSASFGLWSSMLNGPRTPPNTFTTASTMAWCSAGTSDLPVIGATRGMMSSFLETAASRPRTRRGPLRSAPPDDGHARLVVRAQDALAAAPRALAESPDISEERAPDRAEVAAGVHPVGSAIDGEDLLESGHVEPVQLAAVDDDAGGAARSVAAEGPTHGEARHDAGHRRPAPGAPGPPPAVLPAVAVLPAHPVLALQGADLTIGETHAVHDDLACLRVSDLRRQHDGEGHDEQHRREARGHQMTPRCARSAIWSLV